MKDFSLILPTHHHPELVKRLFNSIIETTHNLNSIEIILYLDNDDVESHKISHPFLDIVKLIKQPDAMGSMLRACYGTSQGRYVMLINDDMLFRTKKWDIKVMEAFSRFPDDATMVYGNDLYYGSAMCTFPILSRVACELMDKICPAQYQWHCIDAHIFDIFKILSRFKHKRSIYLSNVIFEHMHHELSAVLNDSEFKPKSDVDDQLRYLSFAQYRQEVATKMFEYIKNRKGEFAVNE